MTVSCELGKLQEFPYPTSYPGNPPRGKAGWRFMPQTPLFGGLRPGVRPGLVWATLAATMQGKALPGVLVRVVLFRARAHPRPALGGS